MSDFEKTENEEISNKSINEMTPEEALAEINKQMLERSGGVFPIRSDLSNYEPTHSTDAAINKAEDIHRRATPAPWKLQYNEIPWSIEESEYQGTTLPAKSGTHKETYIYTAYNDSQLKRPYPVVSKWIGLPEKKGEPAAQVLNINKEDAEFIIEARSLIPELIWHLKAQEKELADLRSATQIHMDLSNHHNSAKCPYCNPELQKQLDKMREMQETIDDLTKYKAMVEACSKYLKEGETPRERMDRDLEDSFALLNMLRKEKEKNLSLQAELDAERRANGK